LLRALHAVRSDDSAPSPLDMATQTKQIGTKRDAHESTIRSVVDVAREVRVHLRDMQVIFGSVAADARSEGGSFRLQPWGMKASIEIQFADVALAAPVKQMTWTQHRTIASAQQAGIFAAARRG
jgi:hypothetical protein